MNKKKNFLAFLFLVAAGMLLPANLLSQEQCGKAGSLLGQEREDKDYGLFGKGRSLFALNINEEDFGATEGDINVEDFGTPVGSGVLVLLAAGAGYAILKRKNETTTENN